MAGKDTNTGSKRARETREDLGLGTKTPIECVLAAVEKDLGLPVVIANMPEGIAGCCWRDGERVVLWVNGTQAPVRQRFTLAHELGHVRCGHDSDLAVDTFETLSGKTTDAREIQANAFAAQLLVPADGVRSLIDTEPTLDDVARVAARFGVSTIAALYRMNTLGLTSRYSVLKQEIEGGLCDAVFDRLGLEDLADGIALVDATSLPRFSPSLEGSALAAVAAGSASVVEAAGSAGCDPERLASGAAAIGV